MSPKNLDPSSSSPRHIESHRAQFFPTRQTNHENSPRTGRADGNSPRGGRTSSHGRSMGSPRAVKDSSHIHYSHTSKNSHTSQNMIVVNHTLINDLDHECCSLGAVSIPSDACLSDDCSVSSPRIPSNPKSVTSPLNPYDTVDAMHDTLIPVYVARTLDDNVQAETDRDHVHGLGMGARLSGGGTTRLSERRRSTPKNNHNPQRKSSTVENPEKIIRDFQPLATVAIMLITGVLQMLFDFVICLLWWSSPNDDRDTANGPNAHDTDVNIALNDHGPANSINIGYNAGVVFANYKILGEMRHHEQMTQKQAFIIDATRVIPALLVFLSMLVLITGIVVTVVASKNVSGATVQKCCQLGSQITVVGGYALIVSSTILAVISFVAASMGRHMYHDEAMGFQWLSGLIIVGIFTVILGVLLPVFMIWWVTTRTKKKIMLYGEALCKVEEENQVIIGLDQKIGMKT